MKQFSKNKDIFISSPDKGKGVVIVDKSRYVQSITQLISDITKFKPITENINKLCLNIEDRINSFSLKLKNAGKLDQTTYSEVYASGSSPGILYGKPKIHKPDFATKFQFRPILAAYNQASFNLAKFMVPILAPLTTNEYTIPNSTKFVEKLSKIRNADKLYMASFDVESLFTNIPLRETINICIDKLYSNSTTVHGFSCSELKKLLELS